MPILSATRKQLVGSFHSGRDYLDADAGTERSAVDTAGQPIVLFAG